MRTLRRRAWLIVAGVLPVSILFILLSERVPDPSWAGSEFHFHIVTLTSFIVTLIAAMMVIAARQIKDARVLFLAMAYLGIAGIFFVHALTTPGVLIQSFTPWVGLSAKLSLLTGSFFLFLSTFHPRTRLHHVVARRQGRVLTGFVSALVVYGVIAVGTSVAGPEPVITALFRLASSDALSQLVSALTIGMFVYVVGRYILLYRVYRTPLITGMLISGLLLTQAQISMEIAPLWHASWWMYHMLMLAAFLTAAGAMVQEYRLSGTLQGVVEGLLLRDSISQMKRGYTDVIIALVGAVEARDAHTRGHSDQVATLAVRIGEELGLSQEELRTLHQSALLHDIGKIGIPDSILNKPGRLTDEEFAVIQEHPVRGYEIMRPVRSLHAELDGVRHHHERLDGSGYPDGLRGDEIQLIARIIAVADVFDALTSERPYRSAYPVDVALEIIDADTPARLDRSVVRALHAVVPALDGKPLSVNQREPVLAD